MTSSNLLPSRGKKTILCIDDEPSCLRFYRLLFEDAGYDVASFTDALSGLEYFSSAHVDLAVLDYSMPRADGADAARAIRRIKPGFPIIMISGRPECPGDARNWVNVYLMKVRDFEELPRQVEKLLAAETRVA